MKYIIDVPNQDYSYDKILHTLKLKFYDDNLSCEVILDAEPCTEPDRKAIEDEVWGFAWEVLQLDLPVFRKIFGYDTDKMDYRDYKDKYEAWKKQKDDNAIKQKVIELADEIGIHKLYAIVRDIRGE